MDLPSPLLSGEQIGFWLAAEGATRCAERNEEKRSSADSTVAPQGLSAVPPRRLLNGDLDLSCPEKGVMRKQQERDGKRTQAGNRPGKFDKQRTNAKGARRFGR